MVYLLVHPPFGDWHHAYEEVSKPLIVHAQLLYVLLFHHSASKILLFLQLRTWILSQVHHTQNLVRQSLQIYCIFWQHADITSEGQGNSVICPSDGKSLTVIYCQLIALEPNSQKEELISWDELSTSKYKMIALTYVRRESGAGCIQTAMKEWPCHQTCCE